MDDDRCLEKAVGIQRFRGYRLRFYRRDSAARNGKRHPGGFRTGTEGGYRHGYVFQRLRKASGKEHSRRKGERGGCEHRLPPHSGSEIQTGPVQRPLPLLQHQAQQERDLYRREPSGSPRCSSRDLRASEERRQYPATEEGRKDSPDRSACRHPKQHSRYMERGSGTI